MGRIIPQPPAAPGPIRKAEIFWVDVNDHLPDDEITVLGCSGDGDVVLAYHSGGHWYRENGFSISRQKPTNLTHWADLPLTHNEIQGPPRIPGGFPIANSQ